MLMLCDKDCKEGLPIPFIGFVCLGLSPLCSSFGLVSEAITIASRGHVCRNSKGEECTQSECRYCSDQERGK